MAEPPGMGLVLDCRDPKALAPFWAVALGHITLGAVENYVLLVPDNRPGPKLLLQRVPEERVGKNRMHLDIELPDIESLAAQLVELGARRLSQGVEAEHRSHWIVMTDPEGNEFCIGDGGATGH